ncbi:MAG: hypothetical protein AAFV31_05745 [Pseudomonadota bacterium]
MPRCWVVGEGTVGAWPATWDGAQTGPQLSLTPLANDTVEVETDADAVTVTVTAPAFYAGSWTVTLADLDAGPVMLAAPGVSGDVADGVTLTVRPGLWAYDGDLAAPVHGYQWAQNGAAMAAETGADLVLPSGVGSSVFTVTETATDANGSRSAQAHLGGVATITPVTGGFRADALPHVARTAATANDQQFTVEAA